MEQLDLQRIERKTEHTIQKITTWASMTWYYWKSSKTLININN